MKTPFSLQPKTTSNFLKISFTSCWELPQLHSVNDVLGFPHCFHKVPKAVIWHWVHRFTTGHLHSELFSGFPVWTSPSAVTWDTGPAPLQSHPWELCGVTVAVLTSICKGQKNYFIIDEDLWKLKSERLFSSMWSPTHREQKTQTTHVIQPPLVVFPNRRQESIQTDSLVIIWTLASPLWKLIGLLAFHLTLGSDRH